jgi:hypothetical protein
MALTHPDTVHSPTSSLSGSSFSMFTSPVSSEDPFEAIDESSSSEDEIVWTANEVDPDEDFILIPQSHAPAEPVSSTCTEEDRDAPPLPEAFSSLSLHDVASATPTTPTTPTLPSHESRPKPRKSLGGHKDRRSAGAPSEVSGQSLASTAPKSNRGRRRRGGKEASTFYPSPSPSPDRDTTPSGKDHCADLERGIRFGDYPLVEETDGECDPIFTKYEDAVCFIDSSVIYVLRMILLLNSHSRFLSNPSAALTCSTYTRLTFLQSLIIELGLMSPSSTLPSSMKSAKHFLKTRAFINIGEYLSVREQGLDKLQQIMFTNRRELTSDLRRKKGGKKADRSWVKRLGLSVLLVSVF